MPRVATKVIKAKIISPTRRKAELLEREYQGFQDVLQGGQAPIYSAARQQAERCLRRIKKPRHRHYPLVIRRDTLKVERRNTRLSSYWARIPIGGIRDGIWVAIIPHCDFPEGCSFREAKVLKLKKGWFIYFTVQKEVEDIELSGAILAIDLGEKYLATVCGSGGIRPQFLGRKARGIRRHYAWLRKRLGERKALSTIKKIGHTEKRKVNALCHQVSHSIVQEAKQARAVIVLGELKGIRARARGKRLNRIVASMPYFKMTQFIVYKAAWEGIPVYQVGEAHTSRACHRCGSPGIRESQALFRCPQCGLQYSADLNGALNILKRSSSYIGEDGAAFGTARNSGLDPRIPRL